MSADDFTEQPPARQQTLFPTGRKQTPHGSVISGTASTSKAAAEQVAPAATSQAARVLGAVRDAGERGLTDPEIEQVTGIAANSTRPRRLWLQRQGYIKSLVVDGKVVVRANCTVWVAVEGRTLRLREVRR